MAEQLAEAGVLLAVGMSVVFAFLSLLIGGIKLIAWFCETFPSPDEQAQLTPSNNNNFTHEQTTVSPQIKAAIQTAVNLHRQQQQ